MPDKINEFGYREITFQAESEEYVHWIPDKKKYYCKNCSNWFTLKEHTNQQPEPKNKLKEIFNVSS